MKEVKFYLGMQLDYENNPINGSDAKAGLNIIKGMLAKRFGGYSCHMVSGGYVNNAGVLCEEQSACISIVTEDVSAVPTLGRCFAEMMAQESVLTVITDAVVAFESRIMPLEEELEEELEPIHPSEAYWNEVATDELLAMDVQEQEHWNLQNPNAAAYAQME